MKRLVLILMSTLAWTNLSADVPMSALAQTNLDDLLTQVEAATGKSREWLLQALVDAESQYDQISRIRDADCKNYSGRVKWHGKRLSREEDLERLLIVETYEDGYVYEEPFKKVEPMSVEARIALEKRRQELATERRLSQLPEAMREVERQRIENEKTTNEVTVVYGD